METDFKAEKVAAEGNFLGWKKMVMKAVQEISSNKEEAIKERLAGLEAAWSKYDQIHYQLVATLDEESVRREQEKWEQLLEAFCLTKEEGMSALKRIDSEYKEVKTKFEKMKQIQTIAIRGCYVTENR